MNGVGATPVLEVWDCFGFNARSCGRFSSVAISGHGVMHAALSLSLSLSQSATLSIFRVGLTVPIRCYAFVARFSMHGF